jgi:thaumarchaeosortase
MRELPSSNGSITSRIRNRLKDADFLLILAAVPVLLLFAVAPASFELSWAGFGKLGRGGLFFVLFFLGFEVLDFRKRARIKWTRTRKIILSAIVVAALFYFVAVGASDWFLNLIYSLGPPGGAGGGSNSWLMSVDYLTFALYIFGLAVVLFGLRAIKAVITPILLSAAMLVFYLLDAFFPYGQIGPLQFWANFIVAGVGLLAKLFGLPIYGFSNYLTIDGTKGFFRLAVYWPSVGVQSMIIYSVVMAVIAAKLDIPTIRKVIYATVGVAGTIFLNVVRIFTIAYYGYAYATSGQQLDAFHNSIGEVLFPIWIAVFMVIVLSIENRITPKPAKAAIHTRLSSGSPAKSRKLGAR